MSTTDGSGSRFEVAMSVGGTIQIEGKERVVLGEPTSCNRTGPCGVGGAKFLARICGGTTRPRVSMQRRVGLIAKESQPEQTVRLLPLGCGRFTKPTKCQVWQQLNLPILYRCPVCPISRCLVGPEPMLWAMQVVWPVVVSRMERL